MKKQLNKIPELKEKFIYQCPREVIGEYVWHSAIEPQMSYAFAEPHALAYSFIAIQILVLTTYYPIIYWNCACLITNSGGDEFQENDELENDENVDNENEELDDNEDDEDIMDENPKKKKKVKNTDYGKVATAIGNFQKRGIKIMPPDVNESGFTFTPNLNDNSITYGLRGITRISNNIIYQIIKRRPYISLDDFLNKNKTNKLQTLNLIKSGAFDKIEKKPREQIIHEYLESITDKKQRLTLQNMQMLINKELIPDEMSFYAKLFLFNKFLKTQKVGIDYKLNDNAINFIANNFSADYINNGNFIAQKIWDNLYKKEMEPMRIYLKDNKDIMLQKLNNALYEEVADKYVEGNISSWEMESINFYYHEHELEKSKNNFDDFNSLPEEPEIEYSFLSKYGQTINVYKIHTIIGTVIDKDKVRNTVTLLTPTGVVLVRIYKNQYAIYDKQISQKDSEGRKHVIEKSWLSRGTKLMIQGIRRGQDFIPKKKKQSVYPIISKIIEVKDDGELVFQYERMEVDE